MADHDPLSEAVSEPGSEEASHEEEAVASTPAVDITALLDSLASGSEEEQAEAAAALGKLARSSAEGEQAAAGAIEPLVGLLSSGGPQAQAAAAGALASLASPSLAEYICDAGGPEALTQLLGSEAEAEVQAAAAAALGALACSSDGRQAVREAGAVDALLGRLKADGVEETVQLAALGALSRLALDSSIGKVLLKAEAVPLLLGLAQQGSEALKPGACQLLLELASGSKAARKAVLDGGGLPALLPLLHSGSGASFEATHRLTRLLASLAQESAEARVALTKAGALPALAVFLLEGNQTMAPGRGAAVEALGTLCSDEDGAPAGKARRQELCGMHGAYALLGFLHTTAQRSPGLAEIFRWAQRGREYITVVRSCARQLAQALHADAAD